MVKKLLLAVCLLFGSAQTMRAMESMHGAMCASIVPGLFGWYHLAKHLLSKHDGYQAEYWIKGSGALIVVNAVLGTLSQSVCYAFAKISLGILIDGHCIDVGQLEACLVEAIPNRFGRKARPVLDAPEALLLHRGDEPSVVQERRRDVAVVRVDAEDVQEGSRLETKVPS